jgi:hypothetical protein
LIKEEYLQEEGKKKKSPRMVGWMDGTGFDFGFL